MTQIKKLGFGAVAAALFALMAMATLVNTAKADVSGLAVSAALVEAGTDVTLTATVTDAVTTGETVTFRILSSTTGGGQLGDSDVQTLTCTVTVTTGGADGAGGSCDDGTLAVTSGADGVWGGTITATLDTTKAGRIDLSASHDGVGAIAQVNVVGETAGDAATLQITAPSSVAATSADEKARVTVKAVNASGAPVPNVPITLNATNAAVTTVSGTTNSSGNATFDLDVNASATSVRLTAFTGTGNVPGGDIVATATLAVGGVAASATVTAENVAAGGTTTVTVEALDANGNAVPNGTAVTVAASEGTVAACSGTSTTTNGSVTCTYVAPTTPQSVVITAVVDVTTAGAADIVATKTIQVTAGTPGGETGDGSFVAAPSFGSGNVGAAVFNGGSIADLADATADAGGTGVWVQATNGNYYRYTVGATGATAFVNNAFNTQFADGFTVATSVTVVK